MAAEQQQTRWQGFAAFLKLGWLWKIVIILGIIGSAVACVRYGFEAWGRFLPVQPNKIVVLGPTSGGENQAWRYIDAGVRAAWEDHEMSGLEVSGGHKLEVKYLSDGSSLDNSKSDDIERIASEYCNDPTVLLVMGYVETSVAARALRRYEACNLPVVLVATTSTTLTRSNKDSWHAPILRLPPSNHQQAVHLVDALVDTFRGVSPEVTTATLTSHCTLLVLKDKDNREYSEDLSNEFSTALRKETRLNCDVRDVAYKDQPLMPLIESGHPNVVILFGMTDKAERLAKEFSRLPSNGSKKPLVILSDGAATDQFVSDADAAAECFWGLFPSGVPVDVAKVRGVDPTIPSFYVYGYDAVGITKYLIQNARRDGKSANRENLGEEFRRLSQRKVFVRGLAGYYDFSPDGGLRFLYQDEQAQTSIDQFHFWRVRANGRKLFWVHRPGRESLALGCEAKGTKISPKRNRNPA
jgi:ABC-type branched-subunit amino acid transport system substrate-binding protein